MGFDWQDIVVALAVCAALAYVVAKARRMFSPAGDGACGSGCHGCQAPPGQTATAGATSLVRVEDLRIISEDRR